MVYKIPCADCDWCYVGETGRCFNARKKEHLRNVKTCASGSNIAKHAWTFGHCIDFDNSCVIDKGLFRTRKTLESWHTFSLKYTDNNSKPLPNQYSILFKKLANSMNTFLLLYRSSLYYFSLTLLCIYLDSLLFRFYPSKAKAR